ncbi:MAG: hypothetical protein OXL96_19800 [Candidatus Poribacteria bacterium]|nr:hypothetical protein [Candidatus Poribacteria bacterium]
MSEIDILRFKNWISNPHADKNWTTVAQQRKYRSDEFEFDYFTTGVLVKTKSSPSILERHTWLTPLDFGSPEIWERGGNVRYNPNSIEQLDDITVEPFVLYRFWYDRHNHARFDVIQDFILFYNLYFDKRENVFKAVHETGRKTDIMRISQEENNKKIEIMTNFLRNYLAFKNQILVRQHDHCVRTTKTLEELGSKPTIDCLKNINYNFELVINEHQSFSTSKSFSRLLGRDLILPADTRKHLLGWINKYCKFIVDLDDRSEEIELTCEQEGQDKFLTPVFFKREVLKKYHDTPSAYTVKPTGLHCGGLWSIDIDTNSKDLVQVWLGDLSHIPYEEQQHWRLHNVAPEGGITPSRYQRDFEAQFADPEDAVFGFKKSLSVLQKQFYKKYGFIPFKPLAPNDSHIIDNIRIPLMNEIPEFETQIGYLAKLLPDSIDIKPMRRILQNAKNVDVGELDTKKDMQIRMFELFLKYEGLNDEIIADLDKIQKIRSSGVAHRKSQSYEKIISKYGLDRVSRIEFFKRIMLDLTRHISILSSCLAE